MFNTKTALFALAGVAMAAPLELTERASQSTNSNSLFSSAADMNACLWTSDMFYVNWEIIMEQFGGKTVPEMFTAVDNALSANSATQSYTWQTTSKIGFGAHNTTIALQFNTDDFATANTMSNLLNKLTGLSGNSGFKCVSSSDASGVDPDLSSLVAELPGEGADEDPSDVEKRSLGSDKSTKTSTATTSTKTSAAATSTKTSAAATSTKTSAAAKSSSTSAVQGTATGKATTAHPSGLAALSKATTIDGISIPALSEMAAKAGLPSTASRFEIVEKLNELAA